MARNSSVFAEFVKTKASCYYPSGEHLDVEYVHVVLGVYGGVVAAAVH